METTRTCEGCEWQHHRHHCEVHYLHKYGTICRSNDSIVVKLAKAIIEEPNK